MSDQELPTKERILKVAGDIFGTRGFKETTIRAISKGAEVNIAAINYHFGDKQGLYNAVLEDVFRVGFVRFPGSVGRDQGIDPEQQLREFIKAMFHRFLSSAGWGGLSGKGRLIARELIDPSPALEGVLDRFVRPHKDLLIEIIIDIMGHNPGPQKLGPCAISIIGQCIYYALGAKVIARISAENTPTEDNLDRLADFVWNFSMGGIARIKDESSSITRQEI